MASSCLTEESIEIWFTVQKSSCWLMAQWKSLSVGVEPEEEFEESILIQYGTVH